MERPTIIKGGDYSDDRGCIRFVNDFQFLDVKRFYFIMHLNTSVVRAWQAHQFEKKYFYPISGSFAIAWVKIDDFNNPSDDLIPEVYLLSAENSEILSVPKGYANGLKAMEPNSELMIFSDMSLEDSLNENIRYPATKWLNWESLTLDSFLSV